MTLDKTVPSAAEAVADMPDSASLAVGGFGLAGIPWFLIEALLEQGAGDLTIVSNNCGVDGLIPDHLPEGSDVTLHAENGILGVGPFSYNDEVDPDLVNAGKQTVSVVGGASYFDSGTSFAMFRGGHVDIAVVSGMRVAANGDLANWMAPGSMVRGMGGAMDLVNGAGRVIVLIEHVSKSGAAKLVLDCDRPLTGKAVASRGRHRPRCIQRDRTGIRGGRTRARRRLHRRRCQDCRAGVGRASAPQCGELRSGAHAELCVDPGEVVLHRLRGDAQLGGDFAIGKPLRDKRRHRFLLRSEVDVVA